MDSVWVKGFCLEILHHRDTEAQRTPFLWAFSPCAVLCENSPLSRTVRGNGGAPAESLFFYYYLLSLGVEAEMLATTLNVEFDPDRSWDEKKEIYRISNKIVRTANITQSAVGDKRGLWTTVIASAVLIFD